MTLTLLRHSHYYDTHVTLTLTILQHSRYFDTHVNSTPSLVRYHVTSTLTWLWHSRHFDIHVTSTMKTSDCARKTVDGVILADFKYRKMGTKFDNSQKHAILDRVGDVSIYLHLTLFSYTQQRNTNCPIHLVDTHRIYYNIERKKLNLLLHISLCKYRLTKRCTPTCIHLNSNNTSWFLIYKVSS